MKRSEKEQLVASLKAKLDGADAVYYTDFTGLNVKAMTQLRRSLRQSDAEYVVVKNRLAQRAFKESEGLPDIASGFQGPTGVVFGFGDVVTTAKVLARAYGTVEAFRAGLVAAAKGADTEAFRELDSIEGIGETVAKAIADFFAEPHNVAVVDDLLKEVSPQPLEAVDTSSAIAGKTVVFTGTLERMTRPEATRRESRQ